MALALCLGLAACSGGGSNNNNTVPALAWGSFRHDSNNSGAGNSINQNKGKVTLLAASVGEATISTPAIDNSGNVFLGTGNGVVSFDEKGNLRWQVTTCVPDDGSPSVPIGRVSSSLTVQSGGTIVFGAEASISGRGGVFYLQEHRNKVSCIWAVPESGAPDGFGVQSSAQTQVYFFDLSLTSVFIGGDDGFLRALNGTGSRRWSFPQTPPGKGPITSTPAISGTGVTYITTPDGFLSAADAAGRLLPSIPIGVPPTAALLQSPAVNISAYAIGAAGALFAINPDFSVKWQYQPLGPVLGSPAYVEQTVDQGPDTVLDTIVYIVDENGELYGVRDQTGEILEIQRCTGDTERSCQMDSCPSGEECSNGKCSSSGEDCTQDSCEKEQRPCFVYASGMLPVTSGTVESSPVVSGDLFAIVGTTDGRVCARGLDATVPGNTDDDDNPWSAGCIQLPDGLPVLSSPVIGNNSRIYVTTASGLYVIE